MTQAGSRSASTELWERVLAWGRRSPERFQWLHYAYVGRDSTSPPNLLDTESVGLFRETESDRSVSYGVEHLEKDFNEISPEDAYPTEAEAQAYAEAEYDLRPADWHFGAFRSRSTTFPRANARSTRTPPPSPRLSGAAQTAAPGTLDPMLVQLVATTLSGRYLASGAPRSRARPARHPRARAQP